MTDTIVVALLSFAGTMGGAFIANRKSVALVEYRLKSLEEKVHKHNEVIERTFIVEKRLDVLEERGKVANHRIDDLEHMNH